MNLYTITIRQSTVTFSFTIMTNSAKSARRLIGRRIRKHYQGFRIYRIQQI